MWICILEIGGKYIDLDKCAKTLLYAAGKARGEIEE